MFDLSSLRHDPDCTFFLIDNSGSMVKHTQKVIDAYEASIDNLRRRPSTKMGCHFITTALFAEDLAVIQEFEKLNPVKGRDKLIPLVEGLPPEGNFYPKGRTALYDCLYEVLESMLQVVNLTADQGFIPRLNIVLFTNGKDNCSVREREALKEVIERLSLEEFLMVSLVVGILDDDFTADDLKTLRQDIAFRHAISVDRNSEDFARYFRGTWISIYDDLIR